MTESAEFLVPEGWNSYLLCLRAFGEASGVRRVADIYESTAREIGPSLGVIVGLSHVMEDPEGENSYQFLLSVAAPPEGTDGGSARVEDLLEEMLSADEAREGEDAAWGGLHGFVFLVPDDGDGDPVRVGNGLVRDRVTGEIRRFPAAAGSFDIDSLMAELGDMDLDDRPGSDTLPNEWEPVPEGSTRFNMVFRIRGLEEAAGELMKEMFSAIDVLAPGAGLTWVGSGGFRPAEIKEGGLWASMDGDRWDYLSHVAALADENDVTRSQPVETLIEAVLRNPYDAGGASPGVFAYMCHQAEGDDEPTTPSGVLFLREPATGEVRRFEVAIGKARVLGEMVERGDTEGWYSLKDKGS